MNNLDNIKLGYSPLGNMIYLFRHGKGNKKDAENNIFIALEKREAMHDVLSVVTEWMLNDMPEGSTIDYNLGDKRYTLTVKPYI